MSVRAYRVNKIDFENSETFNLWHDEFVRDFFRNKGFFENFIIDNGGMVEMSVEVLKELSGLLDEKTEKEGDKKYWQSLKNSIDKDIKWAKERGVEYVAYYCF